MDETAMLVEPPKPKRRRIWRVVILLAIIGGIGVVALGVVIPCGFSARGTAERNMCINNLRQIDAAKEQWVLETGATNGATAPAAEVHKRIMNGAPTCPKGGAYTYGNIGIAPRCTVRGHSL